jgi:hypothetical protein
MTTERDRTVNRLFEEHVRAELSVRWRNEDPATVDLASVDDAGCDLWRPPSNEAVRG